jgi:hypothetical protein
MLLGALRFKRRLIADELKHIRNEVLFRKLTAVDMGKRKQHEKRELERLAQNPEDTIVFIITRDRLTPLKQLLDWFEKQGVQHLVFLDNDSAFPPLMDYLKEAPYQVVETGQNVGHTVPWKRAIIKLLAPDTFYVVTDPDVIPQKDSIDAIRHLYQIHRDFPDHLKVGLGLSIHDLPEGYALRNEVIAWESQFWEHPIREGIFEAGVDTTFALYKPYTYSYFLHPSLRVGKPYTAKHLPWYNTDDELTNEDIFYRLRADQNVNTWDKSKLPERYVKELERQRR